MLVSIVWWPCSLIPTCIAVIGDSPSAKPDPGVTRVTIVVFITGDTNSCFGMYFIAADSVEPFLVTVGLQGGLWTNQRLPRVTTQWGGAGLAVSDQRVQRVGVPVDGKESYLVADHHTEADLGEGCVPVGWQLGLLWIKPSPSSCNVVWIFVAPEVRIVMKSFLKTEIRKLISISQAWNDVLVRHVPLCHQSS